MKYLLVADVGNTHMQFGLYRGDELVCHWCLSSEGQKTHDELAWQLQGMFEQSRRRPSDVYGIMVASVVPHLDTVLAEACERVCNHQPAFVGSQDVKTGMAVDYKNPREVGADRICNALAAREQFGAPVIVVDCGTATTFDIVSPEGHYAGGLIMPGALVSLAALCERAAKLPEVPLTRMQDMVGRDTVSSIQAGSYWATIEGLAGIIRRLHALPEYGQAPVVATGGLAEVIIEDVRDISQHLPHLTLEGLRLLAERHFK